MSETDSLSKKDCLRERRDTKSVKKLSMRLEKMSHPTFSSIVASEQEVPCYELKNTWKVPAIQKLYVETRNLKISYKNVMQFKEKVVDRLNAMHAMFTAYQRSSDKVKD